MTEAMIALAPPVTVRCDISLWSAQQIFSLMILADTQPGSIRILADHNTIEIASTDFCGLFSAMAAILQAIPDSSLKQKNAVPNISHPIPVTEVAPTRSLSPENTVPNISHPIPVTETVRRRVANIFDIRAFKRFAGTILPQR